MSPHRLFPGVVPDGTRWHEAVDAEEHARANAKAIRAYAATLTPPRRGWIARLEWTARVNGLRAAAHLLDERATAFHWHAAQIQEEAK